MAFKAAKENFNKDEVIDILKSNVALYKNEPEFVEYIVNLAMYLLDQKYGGQEPADENMMIPPTGSFMIQDNNELQDPYLSGPTPIKSERERMPPPPVPLNRMPSARPPMPPPGRAPIPQTPPRNAPVPPPTYQIQGQVPLASPTPVPVGPPRHPGAPLPPPTRPPQPVASDPKTPGRPPHVQQERAPLTTPIPDMRRVAAPPPPPSVPPPPGSMPAPNASGESIPKINVSSLGKTRVYKMVRSYNSETAAETPCKICGTKVAVGERQCPGCGHIL